MSDFARVAKFIFKNGEGEFRSGWRILTFLLLFQIFLIMNGALVVGIGVVISGSYATALELLVEPTSTVPVTTYGLVRIIVSRSALLVSALAASAVCARLLERRSFGSVGYKLHKGWLKDFSLGNLVGAATLAVAVAIAAAAGAMTFHRRASNAETMIADAAVLFFVFLIAAAFEEVLVRGFIFQALLHNSQIALGRRGAIVPIAITSLAFGIMHMFNPNATVFAVANTVLAGVWLGVAYLKTRSLWLATALHAAWNFTMVFLFGLPVSGITMHKEMAVMAGEPGPPAWLSGGDYGPEGGAAATLALIICTLAIIKAPVFRGSEEMLLATRHGSLGRPAEPSPAEPSEA
jgi:membrane protease YdiL (CAAX protease family)